MKGGFDLVVYVKYRFKKNKIYLYKKSININRKPMKTADAFIISGKKSYCIILTKNLTSYANFERKLIHILAHEIIHHSLYQIGENGKCNKGFDYMDKNHEISGYGRS